MLDVPGAQANWNAAAASLMKGIKHGSQRSKS